MKRRLRGHLVSAAVGVICAFWATACPRKPDPVHVTISAGPNAQEQIARTLIEARGGGSITLGAGRFRLSAPVVVDAPGIRLRGQGMNETILDFSRVDTGSGDGLLVTADRFALSDLAIESTPGDAVRIEKASGVEIARTRIDWPGPPGPRNGGYGIYPIESEDLVIEDNFVRAASDSGIYVGQSQRAVVRRNEVTESVAGVQIENSVDVVVAENKLHDNSAGLLAFALPELPGETRRVRIASNQIADNNGANFARPGARVAAIPPGTGIVLMAADQVDVRDNRIANHQTANLSIYSQLILDLQSAPDGDDAVPESIWIHANHFAGGGEAPKGPLAEMLVPRIGVPFPDIVYDGVGDLPDDRRFHIGGNGDASFVDLDLATMLRGQEQARLSRDLAPYAGDPSDFPAPAPPELEDMP